jgi:hypothetical protein
MAKPGKRVQQRLRRMAQLRAAGAGWAAVAEQTGWKAAACEALAARYPACWGRLLRGCLRVRVLEVAAEALAVLRAALREGEWPARRATAATLAQYLRLLQGKPSRARSEPPAEADEELLAMVRFLKGLSDADVERLVDDWLERRAERKGATAPERQRLLTGHTDEGEAPTRR